MLNESKFLEIYHRHRESGLTVTDFCSNEGIAQSTFYYWSKKLKEKRGPQDFIPLIVKSPAQHSTQSFGKSFTPVHGGGEPNNDMLLELVYPNGTRLRIKNDIDLTHLRALICLYD